jgi:hypothetical protein
VKEADKMEINPDNLGHLSESEFKKLINELVGNDQHKWDNYRKLYNFFSSLNRDSPDWFPLSEDIDKARAIKYRISKSLSETNDFSIVYSEMCEVVKNYDVIDPSLLEKCICINGKNIQRV